MAKKTKPAKKKAAAERPPASLPTKAQLLEFLKDAGEDARRADIARAFGIKGEARADLRRLLNELEEEGKLARRGRRVAQLDSLPPVAPIDVMSVDDDGDLLCMPSKWIGDAEPPMIRLPARRARKMKPAPGVGDRLLARLTHAGDEGYIADVIRPIGKGAHRFLAIFKTTKFGGLATPVERRARNAFTVSRGDTMGAEDGDLVWVEPLSGRGRSETRARVLSKAGHVDDRGAWSTIALAANGIPVDFPPDVLEEADKQRLPGPEGRDDLRDTPLLTIDPEDARDHDDAVYAEPDEDPKNNGGFRVIVAIADVSWFVRPGGALDNEALRRGNSVYLVDRVVPMLPERLSNDLCSLRENEDRPCLAVEMRLSADGRKLGHRFMRAIMRSHAKLSYGDAQAIIDGEREGAVAPIVKCLHDAFNARMKERGKRAPLDLELPERKIVLNEEGEVASVKLRERFDAHRIIEEFMILANIAAAETLEEKKTPLIYRIHEPPDPEKLDALRDYLASLDYSLAPSGSVRPANFNQVLAIAEKRDEKEMISEVVLRSQRQAVYSTENEGHFGLNIPRYAHFTSPIRRYADLVVHRALVAACKLGKGGAVENPKDLSRVADDISQYERRAVAAERETADRYLADHLAGKIGAYFTGRIRGVTRFGLFIMLDETGADGFAPIRNLGQERFTFVEARHALVGDRTGLEYRLGQPVEARLLEAAPITGGLRLEVVSDPVPGAGKPSGRKPAKKSRPSKKGKKRKEKRR